MVEKLLKKLMDSDVKFYIKESHRRDALIVDSDVIDIMILIEDIPIGITITITKTNSEATLYAFWDNKTIPKPKGLFSTYKEKEAIKFIEENIIKTSTIKGGKIKSKTFLLKTSSVLENEITDEKLEEMAGDLDITIEELERFSKFLEDIGEGKISEDEFKRIQEEIIEEYHDLSPEELESFSKLVEQIGEGKITEEEFNRSINELQKGKRIAKLYLIIFNKKFCIY